MCCVTLLIPALIFFLSVSLRCTIWCWRMNGSTRRLSSTLCTCACWLNWTCWRSRATGAQTMGTQVRRTTRRCFTLQTPQTTSCPTLCSMLLCLSLSAESFNGSPTGSINLVLYSFDMVFLLSAILSLVLCNLCFSCAFIYFSLWMTSRTPPQTSLCSYMLLFLILVRKHLLKIYIKFSLINIYVITFNKP